MISEYDSFGKSSMMTAGKMEGSVTTEVRDEVAWITFSHPEHNSMPALQLARLTRNLLEQGNDPSIKIIVLQSEGDKTFCAGANFGELAAIQSIEDGKEFFMGFAKVILAMRGCGKLIVGRIQGKAVGGGVGLLAAADYCLATAEASVRLSELSIGIGPYVIEPAISRKIGKAAFSQLALNPSEWQPASWAEEKGLYQGCFDDLSLLDNYLNKYLSKMTSHSALALQTMKSLLWEGTDHWISLLEARAEISASLLLQASTQDLLHTIGGSK